MTPVHLAKRLLDQGMARLRAGAPMAAVRALKGALRLELPAASAEEAHSALAEAYQAAGQYLFARRHLHTALAIAPGRAELHHRMALLLELDETTGDPQRAARHYAKAARLDPRNAGYRRDYGLCLAALGKPQASLKQLRLAYDLNPDDLDSLRALALLLAELDREAAARRLLKSAAFRHQHASAYQQTLQLVEFTLARRRQEAEAREVTLVLHEPPVILPFSAPPQRAPKHSTHGMVLRFDRPSTSKPHVPRPARFRQFETN